MFKHYLKDMRVCLVEILDDRNYEPIGHCYINWLTHMRPIDDAQMFVDKVKSNDSY